MKENAVKLFGLEFRVREAAAKELPLYLSAGRTFMKLSGIGMEFLLVRIPADEKTGIVALEKQAALLAEKYGMPAAFGFETISRARRDSLIERNIPFIVDSEQLYLPCPAENGERGEDDAGNPGTFPVYALSLQREADHEKGCGGGNRCDPDLPHAGQ